MARRTKFSDPLQNGLQVLIRDLVASYPYLVSKLDEVNESTALSSKGSQDGMPRGNRISDSTARLATDKVILIPELTKKIMAIDLARETTDEEYREAVWVDAMRDINTETILCKYAVSRNTLWREKNWFYKKVAYLLGYWEPKNPMERQLLEQDLQKEDDFDE